MNKELIFIGLGRMGSAMTENLVEKGYRVHGFDVSGEARQKSSEFGVIVYESISQAINAVEGRKVIWLMAPSGLVDQILNQVYESIQPGDIIIDGGNSFFEDTIRRAKEAKDRELEYVDCGTSGGIKGARYGASLMVGGEKETIEYTEDIFKSLATDGGYGHVGKTGAGHFVKMVHNGIEYGMMGAIAEGISFIEDNKSKLDINVSEVMKPYQNGSIISSSLMNWMAESFYEEGYLEKISGEVPQGETEIEMEFIAKHQTSLILEAALKQRKETRIRPSRIGTLISAMRNKFGGHKTIKK